MSLPEGWDWVNELPTWEPPEELRGPVGPVALNLAIRVLSCDVLSNHIRALVGSFITEYSLFNIWFARDVKSTGLNGRRLAQLSTIGREQTRLVYEDWRKFEAAIQADGPNEQVRLLVETRADSLAASLRNAVAAFQGARGEVI